MLEEIQIDFEKQLIILLYALRSFIMLLLVFADFVVDCFVIFIIVLDGLLTFYFARGIYDSLNRKVR